MRVEIDEAGNVTVGSSDPRVVAEVKRAVAALLAGDYEEVTDFDDGPPPPDLPLGPQLRDPKDGLSAFQVLDEAFFSGRSGKGAGRVN